MLIGDRFDPVAIVGLFGPRPLRLSDRIEVVTIPDVQAKRTCWVTPLHNAIQFAVQVFAALQRRLPLVWLVSGPWPESR